MDGNERPDCVYSKLVTEYKRAPGLFDKQRLVSDEGQLALAEGVFHALLAICERSGVAMEVLRAYDTSGHNISSGHLTLYVELSPVDLQGYKWSGVRLAYASKGGERRGTQEWVDGL